VIEGHADSRGTNEYNLALGERRADAVRDYLVSLGVSTDRMSILSKGEEQPFCREETEACWPQNRRGHFVVTAR
jgi:peptidoglycan-associated lipoprotein